MATRIQGPGSVPGGVDWSSLDQAGPAQGVGPAEAGDAVTGASVGALNEVGVGAVATPGAAGAPGIADAVQATLLQLSEEVRLGQVPAGTDVVQHAIERMVTTALAHVPEAVREERAAAMRFMLETDPRVERAIQLVVRGTGGR